MRRGPIVLLGVLASLAILAPPRLEADTGTPVDLPDGVECYAVAPHVGTDVNRKTIRADIVIALDGVSVAEARQVVASGSEPYARASTPQLSPDVDINVVAYHDITGKLRGDLVVNGFITADEPTGTDLMSQLIRYYRTKHPKLKRHHVHLLIRRDIAAELVPGQKEYAIAGIANCIGAIGTKHAYAISESGLLEPFEAGGITFEQDRDAKNFAHEMGHIFGAHHHYANCVEDLTAGARAGTGDVCSLMFNDLALLSRRFSVIETQAIRGYAEAHIAEP